MILITVLELQRAIHQIAYFISSNDWTSSTLQFIIIIMGHVGRDDG